MEPTTTENELVALERKYWQAIKDKDVDAAKRLTDDPCLVAGAQGVGRIDGEKFASVMRGARYTLVAFEIKDPEVRMLGPDVGIVAYKVYERLTVEGKPVMIEAANSSAWVRKNGTWVCALHTESLAGDPFGRDKHRAS